MAVTIEVRGDNLEQKEYSNTRSFPPPEHECPHRNPGRAAATGKVRRAPMTARPADRGGLTWSSVYARMPFMGPSAAAFTTLLMSSYLA